MSGGATKQESDAAADSVGRSACIALLPTGFVKVTDWESGLSAFVDRACIRSVKRIAASIEEAFPGESPREYGERTRIDTVSDMLLVRESPEYVMGLTDKP